VNSRSVSKIDPLEGLLLILLGGFAVAFLVLSKDYGATAALFPRWVAGAALLSLVLALPIEVLRQRKTASLEPAAQNPDSVAWPLILLLQGGYVLFIYVVGFSGATLLFLLFTPVLMHYRRWNVILLYGILLTAAVAGSFMWLFNVRFPKGILWDMW
jgi:hypothetical protein